MERKKLSATLAALALYISGTVSGSLAADHREAPAISEDPAADAILSTTPNAAEANNPQDHDLIEVWRSRGNPKIPKREIRPPVRRSQPSSLN